ncbi:hypothetical protein KC678_04200 [Candidatus Dojkabacteria bacterium]|uniref:Uncharacterized protein n=1 Tax=Candidatus Dojkabacteria bacterium TaxID=2099670 RepID=A0A955L209_9BACT|nr:hypothetical protein [Candidatus Dojkabacteria bacterium]
MPSLRKNNEPAQMGMSPLAGQTQEAQPSAPVDNSTIHPDRFDMSRFSERQDEEESSLRIIIYVVVVIVIGVGLALLVRNLISTESNADTPEPSTDNSTIQLGASAPVTIDTATSPDPSDAPANEDLVDSLTLSVGNSSASTDGVSVSSMKYKRYTTYARVDYSFEGVESQADLPKIAINYDNTRNSLEIIFPTSVEMVDELKETIPVNDIVSNIVYNADTNSFTINVSEEFKYLVVPTTGGLTIDIRTVAQIERSGEDTTTDTTQEDTTTGEPDAMQEDTTTDTQTPTQTTTPPSGTKLINDFSQDKQYVSGGAAGNTINLKETFFEDTASYFEIAWGEPNVVGADKTPYTSAELVIEGNVPYIVLTIENLNNFPFNKDGITTNLIPFDMSAANFVRADLESFTNGKAVVKVQLKNKAEFRLVSAETVSGKTQVLSLQIKD